MKLDAYNADLESIAVSEWDKTARTTTNERRIYVNREERQGKKTHTNRKTNNFFFFSRFSVSE